MTPTRTRTPTCPWGRAVAAAARLGMVALAALAFTACRATAYGVYHEVRDGETLYRIATTYDVNPDCIAEANRLPDPERIYPGQQLFVPGAERVLAVPERPSGAVAGDESAGTGATAEAAPRFRPRPAAPRSTGPRPVTPRPTPPADQQASLVPVEPADDGPPPTPITGVCANGRPCPFIWPVNGVVTSRFGRRWNRMHKGIDIQAPLGASVMAAADGEVVFSASQQRGYGDLVLIQHANDWITVYAHLSARLVQEGDRVRQGQIVGRVGRTGNAQAFHLHFETRRQRQAVDPLDHLPRLDSAPAGPVAERAATPGG